ncbi:MAG TPA: gluconate 2-dehydrogenase subunit 3 family protein [Thermoanaerobaculia bacterium]|nr:gluconate 2-dehydrogenase subunit 3 family protein [Thermoanaerobaculia bacterium]
MHPPTSPAPILTRRDLLRRGILGTLLFGAAGATAAFWWPTRRRRPRPGLRVFDEREASILAAVAETILAIEPGAPTADEVDVVGRVDALLARSPAAVQRELARLLRLFENGATGLLTVTGWTSFTAAGPARREARLRAWQTSRIAVFRTGFQAMKRLCGAAYYSAPKSWPAVGYPGPPEVLA